MTGGCAGFHVRVYAMPQGNLLLKRVHEQVCSQAQDKLYSAPAESQSTAA